MHPDQLVEQLPPRCACYLVFAALLEIFPDFGAQLGDRCELARHPGQLVVDCGQHFLFNGLDLHAVADGPSLQTRARVILRVGNFKLAHVPGSRTAKVLREGGERPLASEVHQALLNLHRRLAGLFHVATLVADDHVIVIRSRAVIDHLEGRQALAQGFEGFVDGRFRDPARFLLDLQSLVVLQLEFRIDLKRRLAGQRLIVFKLELFEAGLADHRPVLALDRIPKELRHQRLYHLALDLVAVTTADHSRGSMSGPEPGNPGHARVLRHHVLCLPLDDIGRNLNHQFSRAVLGLHNSSTACLEGEINRGGCVYLLEFDEDS